MRQFAAEPSCRAAGRRLPALPAGSMAVLLGGLLPACWLFALPPARAADIRQTGRRLAKQHEAAVVTVRIVISQKMSFGARDGDEDETQTEEEPAADPEGYPPASPSRCVWKPGT